LKFENLWGDFEREINHYDAMVLFTDDDPDYNVYESKILHRTLMIEHCIFRRRDDIPHTLSTRPFDFSLLQEAKEKSKFKTFDQCSSALWGLPTYPFYKPERKPRLAELTRQTAVCILGGFAEYNIDLIHRLRPLSFTDPKIKIYAVSRHMELNKFDALDKERFEVEIHKNIPMDELVAILRKTDFLLTDVSKDNEYNTEKVLMSGCIPMAFSFLVPLIISKQTNQYYQFHNVIEFDKNTQDPIELHTLDYGRLHQECEKMTDKNMLLLDQSFQRIFHDPIANNHNHSS
jgi:hypothetical protein